MKDRGNFGNNLHKIVSTQVIHALKTYKFTPDLCKLRVISKIMPYFENILKIF